MLSTKLEMSLCRYTQGFFSHQSSHPGLVPRRGHGPENGVGALCQRPQGLRLGMASTRRMVAFSMVAECVPGAGERGCLHRRLFEWMRSRPSVVLLLRLESEGHHFRERRSRLESRFRKTMLAQHAICLCGRSRRAILRRLAWAQDRGGRVASSSRGAFGGALLRTCERMATGSGTFLSLIFVCTV